MPQQVTNGAIYNFDLQRFQQGADGVSLQARIEIYVGQLDAQPGHTRLGFFGRQSQERVCDGTAQAVADENRPVDLSQSRSSGAKPCSLARRCRRRS